MKHINTLVKKSLVKSGKTGCGECQSSCQSACKTSCTVGNQTCKQANIKVNTVRKAQNI
jgi:predicted ribosomally synthesized six-cysteine peptide SCIFF